MGIASFALLAFAPAWNTVVSAAANAPATRHTIFGTSVRRRTNAGSLKIKENRKTSNDRNVTATAMKMLILKLPSALSGRLPNSRVPILVLPGHRLLRGGIRFEAAWRGCSTHPYLTPRDRSRQALKASRPNAHAADSAGTGARCHAQADDRGDSAHQMVLSASHPSNDLRSSRHQRYRPSAHWVARSGRTRDSDRVSARAAVSNLSQNSTAPAAPAASRRRCQLSSHI